MMEIIDSKFFLMMIQVLLVYPLLIQSDCCTTCLDTYSSSNADSVNWDQCSAVQKPCCFDCGTFSEPTPLVDEKISPIEYNDGKATISTGYYIYLQWSNVDTVRYIRLSKGQNRTSQVSSSSTKAELKNDYFYFCAISAGKIYYRGFKDKCSASKEYSIEITQGNSTTCSANTDAISIAANSGTVNDNTKGNKTSPSPSADSNKVAPEECNPLRGSLNAEGKCVCASDWAGPPSCSKMPLWKWLVSIGGGVAAAMSIGVSAHALLKKHKKKNQDDNDETEEDGETIETLQITPNNCGAYFKKAPPSASSVTSARMHSMDTGRMQSFDMARMQSMDRPSSLTSGRPTIGLKQECSL